MTYQDPLELPPHYTASLLELTDKADGTKRQIHHLSYPPGDTSAINNGIPEEYSTLRYSTIDEAVSAIQQYGKDSLLVKRDFESAFRHIPVSPLDSPLLGFKWDGKYYAECFLPFGLRTAPYLFNLFAEVFHWILEDQLNHQNLQATVIHYLNDLLIIIPRGGSAKKYSEVFTRLCAEVGLAIKVSKNEEGLVASFGGVELDTRTMVIRLPEKKLRKVRNHSCHPQEEVAFPA